MLIGFDSVGFHSFPFLIFVFIFLTGLKDFFSSLHMACGTLLVPQPGIKPVLPVLEAQS